jgi:hypothetical protein
MWQALCDGAYSIRATSQRLFRVIIVWDMVQWLRRSSYNQGVDISPSPNATRFYVVRESCQAIGSALVAAKFGIQIRIALICGTMVNDKGDRNARP